MPAFAYLSKFREGQWRAFRKFLLEERRDAGSRFDVIDAERARIGEVRIIYTQTKNSEGTVEVSEKRKGLAVSEGSSLAKLISAYVSLGGNPFDISMFLTPDSDVGFGEDDESTPRFPQQPGGGVLHSQDIRYSYDQGAGDGDTNLVKYRASRIGGKRATEKEMEISAIMFRGRKWISKEIYWKRTRIEEMIIKLCDLREQLDEEVEDIIWAVAGDQISDQLYDSERFTDSLTAANIAYFFDSSFRIPDATTKGKVEYDNDAAAGEPGAKNTAVLAGFETLMDDKDEEDNTAF